MPPQPFLARVVAVLVALTLLSAACSPDASFEATVAAPVPEPAAEPEPDPEVSTEPAPGDEPEPEGEPAGPAEEDLPIVDGNWAYDDDSCPFDEPSGVDTRCGRLTVPVRWDEPGGDQLELAVAVFSEPGASATNEPVVYLEGGPGGHALETIPFGFSSLFEPLLVAHDVIVFDQRGTGYAEPGLSCPESTAADLANAAVAESDEAEFERSFEGLAECRDRLVDAGVDLAAFNSVASAHDTEALRQALGYERWNLFAISYGTRLAQTLMREHPDGIASAVLDSTVPLEGDLDTVIPTSAKRAFETLFANCEADPACNAAYPDLENRFFAVVDAADADPFEFEASDPLTGETYQFVATGTDILGLGFQALYSQSLFAGLPESVARLEVGDTSPLAAYAGIQLLNDDFFSVGMFISVECNEENSFSTLDDYTAGLTGDPRYDRLADGSLNAGEAFSRVCGLWGAGAADPIEDEPLVSAIPTLVMAGEYDPITPPSGGEQVAADLDNGLYAFYPGLGHAVMGDACPQQMALEFFADPTGAPDDGCIGDIAPPAWLLDDLGDLTLTGFDYDEGFISGSGVRPEAWFDQGSGAFAPGRNVFDQTAIVQQVVDQIPRDFAVDSLAEALEPLAGPVLYDERSVGAAGFSFYELELAEGLADLVVGDDGESTFVVILIANDESDRATLRVEVLEPALEAIGP